MSLNLIVSQHPRVITLARIVFQQQLATEAKPRTKLTDYRDRSRQYTRQVYILTKINTRTQSQQVLLRYHREYHNNGNKCLHNQHNET